MPALPKPIRRKTLRLQHALCGAGLLALGCCGGVTLAFAQQSSAGKSVSYPVVQPLPSPESLELNAALAKLGRNPRDLDALLDAGKSALAMGDVDAAFGFFKRADQISSGNPRVKAGLGAAMVRKGQPLEAIGLFDEAERAGASVGALAADRGLAYDLVGDNGAAQRQYRLALAGGPDEEITRRLALSLAVSGDRRGFEATLLPLLKEQDKAAWRTRAFGLAILGDVEEAVRLVKTLLPAKLAEDVAPYLRYMPRLTQAQQAAAAILGNFPRASEIGRDDPRIAQYVPAKPSASRIASVDSGLVPKGEPLGTASRSAKDRQDSRSSKQDRSTPDEKASQRKSSSRRSSQDQADRTVPPEPQPARKTTVSAPPALAAATPAQAPAPVPAQAKDAVSPSATAAGPEAKPASQPSRPVAAPGFDLASMPASQSSPPTAVANGPEPQGVATPAETSGPPDEARPTLAEAFSDLGKPTTAPLPAAGAVDIRKITPAQPKVEAPPKEESKPPPPSHPSRIWVQLGVGRNKGAIAYDWRKLTRQNAELFKNKKAFTSVWGQTNRILTGPFESERAAKAFLAELKELQIDGPYVWISPAGQVVDALSKQ